MRMLLSIILMALASSAARAEWVHSKEEDPFQGDAHLALAIEPDSGYIAGFRCIAGAETDLTFIFGTPERMEEMHGTNLSAIPIKLLIIVDDQPKVAIDGKADTVGERDLLRIQSNDPAVAGLVKGALAARHRFAVAAELGGKIFHSHTFSLQGSTRAITEFTAACKLP